MEHASKVSKSGKSSTAGRACQLDLLASLIYPRVQERGFVLIWTMFIVMALFAAAGTLAMIMNSSLRIAGSIDTGVPAFYAAESCIERAQFYILQQDLSLTNTQKVSNLNQTTPPSPAPAKTVTLNNNGATWTRLTGATGENTNVQCFPDTATSPNPCGIVVVSCRGSFKGTGAGISARIQ